MTSLAETFDKSNPNTLADNFRIIKLGKTLRALPTQLFGQVPNTAPAGKAATAHAIVLPDDAKGSRILEAISRAGTVTGYLTPQVGNAVPATTKMNISPDGDIQLLGTDAITLADVLYQPARYDIVQLTSFPVVANVLTLPTALAGKAMFIIAVYKNAAGVLTRLIVDEHGAATASGKAELNLLKTTITFNAAQSVTFADVKLAVQPAVDMNALLEADATTL